MAGERLMIVEDEGLVALDIRRRLEALGYVVVDLASTGEDAVRKEELHRPDLILMDIRLGKGMDGIEAAERIQSARPVPIVYLTANSDRATLDRARVTGPHGYILKPFRDRELQIALEMSLYRHKAENALRASREWFTSILQSIEEAVIARDADGAIRYMNAAAERLTGWREEEAKGRPLEEVAAALDAPSSAPGNFEARRIDLGMRLQDREGDVVAYRDVTRLRELESRLMQKHKMEAVGQLAGGIAHDFNNLLTAIIGFSNLLKAKLRPEDPLQEDVQLILQSGERAADLTRQLLAFSRRQPLVLTDQDLGALARNMDKLLRRVLGERVELATEGDPELWMVQADAGQMEQVILNLAVNARDAMPEGGRLVIQTRNAPLGDGAPAHGERVPPGDYVMLSVSDTGAGMDAEVLPRIFEPFFTTKGPGEGTGMGLATVHGIVKQSGGFVDVRSERGRGTEFRIYLPAIRAARQPAHLEGAPEGSGAAGGGETLLVVDDERIVRAFMCEALSGRGYRVLEADGPDKALEIISRSPGEVRLLLTDVAMPGMQGQQLAVRAKALDPTLEVLFVSGYADRSMVNEGVLREGVSFLPKPFTPDILAGKVREILASKRNANPS
jgi:signal transduction histidine kinase